jgi:signal peptide peptidase SppA
MKYERILRAFDQSVWAILPEKLEAIAALLELRARGDFASRTEIEANTRRQRQIEPVGGKIALLNIEGTITQKASFFSEWSGGASTEAIGKAFDAAMKDDEIGAVLMNFDSPGGGVYGVPELAEKIYSSRGKKPIYAFAGPMACSAAYWLASAADQVIVQPSGEVGSIGVFVVHADASKLHADIGIKHTFVKAGRYKTDGNNLEPLADSAREYLQSRVDGYYEDFVRAVAKHRGTTPEKVRDGYGEGRSLRAADAVKAGLADRVATFEEVVSELTGSASRGKRVGPRADQDYWNKEKQARSQSAGNR